MSIIDQFQKLDDLIIENTQPPVRTILRNQLALTREQLEAYQASSDSQDKTLSAQIKTIERLVKENEQLKTKDRDSVLRVLHKLSEDKRKLRESYTLNYDA
jgi:hypothetical protein